MPNENLDVFSTLYGAMNAPPVANKGTVATPVRGGTSPERSKLTEREAQLLYRLQVEGSGSLEVLSKKMAIPLGDVVITVAHLVSQGYVAISIVNRRNVVELTDAGTSLTLGEL